VNGVKPHLPQGCISSNRQQWNQGCRLLFGLRLVLRLNFRQLMKNLRIFPVQFRDQPLALFLRKNFRSASRASVRFRLPLDHVSFVHGLLVQRRGCRRKWVKPESEFAARNLIWRKYFSGKQPSLEAARVEKIPECDPGTKPSAVRDRRSAVFPGSPSSALRCNSGSAVPCRSLERQPIHPAAEDIYSRRS
jgi:hypothetical protein